MADTKTSDETAAGTLDGSELVRIVQGGNNRQTTAQDIADLGGGSGGGLYAPVIAAVPTSAGTGLSTWVNQDGATVADRATGITIAKVSKGSDSVACRIKTPLAAPYTVSALIGVTTPTVGAGTNGLFGGAGWYDGTKLHILEMAYASGWVFAVGKWTNVTTVSANDVLSSLNVMPEPMIWLHLVDDATNVKFGFSRSGVAEDSHILFSVAKASGHLGATGYSNIGWCANSRGADIRVSLLAWTEASGAAF